MPMPCTETTEHTLRLLRAFRDDVWGNNDIFKRQDSTAEYLDFPPRHLEALQMFCHPMTHTDKIFVFDEYKAAISKFKSDNRMYENGACITGQPGIGKSAFVAYAVIDRLRERQPVAVHIPLLDSYVIFSADGVTAHPRTDGFSLEDYPGIWTWSDSDAYFHIPPAGFLYAPGVRVFHTTCPALHRCEGWTKEREVNLYVMDLPSSREISDFALTLGFNPEKMKSLSDKWGRVPRTLTALCEYSVAETLHEDSVLLAAWRVATNVEAALTSVLQDDLSYVSHIFFMKPALEMDPAISRCLYEHYIPTKWLSALLADKVAEAAVFQGQIEFFGYMSRHPHTRTSAVYMFGTIIQHYLEAGKIMTIHWLKDPRTVRAYQPTGFRVRYDVENLDRVFPFYWQAPRNYTGVDGALITKDHVLLLHMAFNAGYIDPQIGVDMTWNSELGEKMRDVPWSLVFVGPDDRVVTLAERFAGELHYGDARTGTHATMRADFVETKKLHVGHATIHLPEIFREFKFVVESSSTFMTV